MNLGRVRAVAALLAGVGTFAPLVSWGAAPEKDRFTTQQRKYWAFQKVVRPATPAVKRSRWVRNPIDAFILAKLEAKGITPGTEADKVTLLRRVTLDLTAGNRQKAASMLGISERTLYRKLKEYQLL